MPAVVVARLFGVLELYVLAALVAALVVVALAYVRLVPVRLELRRSVYPSRVHAGESTRIELFLHNPGRRRTPALRVIDPIGSTPGPRLHLAPLAGGARARAAYRLPTARRGRVPVGPLRLEVADPLGLARRRVEAAGAVDITVYPHVDALPALGTGGDQDPTGTAVRVNAVGSQGEEFFGLREYVVGDELRRVHWPSTARRDGELLVRQDERPWANRTTVVLDTRSAAQTPASFERAVSTAASAIEAAHRAHHTIQLVATDGRDSGAGAGLAHAEAIMEYLATVERGGSGSLRAVLARMERPGQGGTLVLALGRVTPAEAAGLAVLRRTYAAVVVAVHEPPVPAAARSGRLRIVDATGSQELPAAWASAARRRTGVPA